MPRGAWGLLWAYRLLDKMRAWPILYLFYITDQVARQMVKLVTMRFCCVGLALALAVAVLAGCVGGKPSPTPVRQVLSPTQEVEAAEVSEAQATPTPEQAPPTPRPTDTPAPTPAPTDTPTPSPPPTQAPTAVTTQTTAEAPTPMATSVAAPSLQLQQPAPARVFATSDGSIPGLTRLRDPSPGPPFTILVSSVIVGQDSYKVTGIVRNDGTETYEGVGVYGNFYTYDPTYNPNSEAKLKDRSLYPHGHVMAECPCTFLKPGQECPFSLETYARDYVAYALHAEGQPIAFFKWHEEASVVLSGVSVGRDAVGNVRITGLVVNKNDFPVKSATVAGTLIDAGGRIVSLGSTIVLGDIEPGGSAPFDLRIKYAPYARYELSVEGVRY